MVANAFATLAPLAKWFIMDLDREQLVREMTFLWSNKTKCIQSAKLFRKFRVESSKLQKTANIGSLKKNEAK
jgi:hypothetical protein